MANILEALLNILRKRRAPEPDTNDAERYDDPGDVVRGYSGYGY